MPTGPPLDDIDRLLVTGFYFFKTTLILSKSMTND